MIQSVKCLSHQHEDLNPVPSPFYESRETMHVYNPRTGKAETGEFLALFQALLPESMRSKPSKIPCLKI